MNFKKHVELIEAALNKKIEDNPVDIRERFMSMRQGEQLTFTPVLDENERTIIREISMMRLHVGYFTESSFNVLKDALLAHHEEYEEYECCAIIMDYTWENVKETDLLDPIASAEINQF